MEIQNIARGICIQDGKILLAYSKQDHFYFFPGGHIEFGEGTRETLAREFFEEIGVRAEATRFISVLENSYGEGEKKQHEFCLLFEIEVEKGVECVSKEAHLEFHWVAFADLGTVKLLPKYLVPFIADFCAGKPIPTFLSTIEK